MIPLNFFSPIANAAAFTVVHSIWQIIFICFVAGLILTFAQHKKARFRYNVLFASLILVVLCSSITFYYFYDKSQDLFAVTSSDITSNPTESGPVNQATSTENPIRSFTISESIDNFTTQNLSIILVLWLVGVAMAILRLLTNISYVHYLRKQMNFPVEDFWVDILNSIKQKMAVSKSIALVESALVRAPIVIGHLKPMVLFPIGAINRLNVEEVESILAHELAHISRNDYIVNIFATVIESIFYFHPGMWWLSNQIRVEREHCCDDVAIAITGSPVNYAKSLVAVQEMVYYSPQLAMAFATKEKKSQLAVRINRLFSKPVRAINSKEKGIATIIVLFLIGFLTTAAYLPSNTAHCLPQNETLSPKEEFSFVKFLSNGELDSLYIPFVVEDGPYNYSDELYHVSMVVRNRRVIAFNLNGMDVSGRDISKFQRLIERILQRETSIKNEMQEDLYDLSLSLDDSELAAMDAKARELNEESRKLDAEAKQQNEEARNETLELDRQAKMLDILALKFHDWGYNNKKLSYAVNINENETFINGKKLNDPQHKEIIKICNKFGKGLDIGMQRNFTYVPGEAEISTINKNGRKYSPPAPPSPPSASSPTYPPSASAPTYPPYPPSPSADRHNSSSYSFSTSNSDSDPEEENAESKFDQWLEDQLYKDGYIRNINRYHYSWNRDEFTVDGRELNKEDMKRYEKVMEQMTGRKITKTFTITRTVNNN